LVINSFIEPTQTTKQPSLRGKEGRWIFSTTDGDGKGGRERRKKVKMQLEITLTAAQ
jgi:hypothetical protein